MLNKEAKPNYCAFCFKETKFPDDKFCSPLCELDYNEPVKTRTMCQVIRMTYDKNGDFYVAE